MIDWISLFVAILGGIVFYFSGPAPAPPAGPSPASRWSERKELGRIAFAMGLLAFLLEFGARILSIGVR